MLPGLRNARASIVATVSQSSTRFVDQLTLGSIPEEFASPVSKVCTSSTNLRYVYSATASTKSITGRRLVDILTRMIGYGN